MLQIIMTYQVMALFASCYCRQ